MAGSVAGNSAADYASSQLFLAANVQEFGRFFMPRQLSLVAAIVVLTACASSTGSGRTSASSPEHITSVEIATTSATNAFELINRLRPNWLRAPATGSISGMRSQLVLVYLDGQRLGDLQSLQSLSASGIRSMQW